MISDNQVRAFARFSEAERDLQSSDASHPDRTRVAPSVWLWMALLALGVIIILVFRSVLR